MPVGTVARSPGSRTARLARGEVEARHLPRTPGSGAPRRRAADEPRPRSPTPRPPRPCSPATRNRAKRATSGRGRRARMRTPSGRVVTLRDRRAERRTARPGRRPSSYGTSRRTSSNRSEKSSAMRALSASSPSPGARRDLQRARERVGDPPAGERVEEVDLVQNELDRDVVGADLAKDGLHRRDRLGQPLLGERRVRDVQDEVGDERLLERRRESLDELRRETPDEADRVRHEVPLPVVLERPGRRVERLEEAIVDGGLGSGERVQQRRLADVRVPGERDGRRARPAPLLAARRPLSAEAPQAALDERDARSARAAGRSRAGSPPAPASRRRRRVARGAATSLACAGGCTRAARARPGASPRRFVRAGRRCRGSAASGRRRAP